MVTTQDMRVFSLECLKWADETANPSDRALILRVAHFERQDSRHPRYSQNQSDG
jgi:hypothetical protein